MYAGSDSSGETPSDLADELFTGFEDGAAQPQISRASVHEYFKRLRALQLVRLGRICSSCRSVSTCG